ncbi:MAG: exosortase/archaeosortase family protein [Bacteroidetes bacterium]|nr:exosortase/archaeosortase family protein [Bacteroidota bacterium]
MFTDKRLILPVEFVLKMLLVYAAWRLFKYGGEHYEHFMWGGWEYLKNTQGRLVGHFSAMQLRAMGYQVTDFGRMIIVDGTPGIFIGDLCLGIAPMVIFSGFILVFGDNGCNKAWFIPLGLLLINVINVFRTSALVLVQVHYERYFKLAHENIYLYLTYGLILLLLLWWMNGPAFKKVPETTAS